MNAIGFYLSNKHREVSSINMVVRFKGKHFKLPAGVSVKTEFWNKEKQRAREIRQYDHGYHINSKLNSFEIATRQALQSFDLKNVLPTSKELATAIEAIIKPETVIKKSLSVTEFITVYIENVVRAQLTLKRYHTTLIKLQEYEKSLGITLEWEDINMVFYNHFIGWMNANKFSYNYTGDVIKNLKAFFDVARDEGLHDLSLSKKFKVLSEDSDSIYLNLDELSKIHNLVIDEALIIENRNLKILNVKGNIERMIESLTDCRDRFLIGAFTALRFGDYSDLAPMTYNDDYITRISRKTNTKTAIPMHQVIREILKRRNNQLPPAISNQKMNEQLKVLAELAGIKDNVEITITRGGKQERTIYKKYELVSTHTARRSGATNMFLAGINPISIMAFTGHRTLKSFMKYIKATSIENAQKEKDNPFFKLKLEIKNPTC